MFIYKAILLLVIIGTLGIAMEPEPMEIDYPRGHKRSASELAQEQSPLKQLGDVHTHEVDTATCVTTPDLAYLYNCLTTTRDIFKRNTQPGSFDTTSAENQNLNDQYQRNLIRVKLCFECAQRAVERLAIADIVLETPEAFEIPYLGSIAYLHMQPQTTSPFTQQMLDCLLRMSRDNHRRDAIDWLQQNNGASALDAITANFDN